MDRPIVSDNSTELTSNAILRWANHHKVLTLYRFGKAGAVAKVTQAIDNRPFVLIEGGQFHLNALPNGLY